MTDKAELLDRLAHETDLVQIGCLLEDLWSEFDIVPEDEPLIARFLISPSLEEITATLLLAIDADSDGPMFAAETALYTMAQKGDKQAQRFLESVRESSMWKRTFPRG